MMISINQIKKKINQDKEKKEEQLKLEIRKRTQLIDEWIYHLRTFLGNDFDLRTDGYKSSVSADIDIKIPGTDFHARIRFNESGIRFLPSNYNSEHRGWILVNKNIIEREIERNVKTVYEWRMK